MNDLSLYNTARSRLRAGDVIAFSGTVPISWLIRFFSASNITHVGIVRQPAIDGADVMMAESTIENGRNGAQTNQLGATLATYGRASASALRLRDDIRSRIDWQKFYAFIGGCEDHLRYDVKGLFLFLAASAPLFGQFVRQSEDPHKMFCDAYVIAILEACGVLRGINYRKMKPQDLVEMGLYQPEPVPLLGNLKIRNFNTIL